VTFNYQINDGQYVLWGHAKVPFLGTSEKDCQVRASGGNVPDPGSPFACSANWQGDAATSSDPGVSFRVAKKPSEVVTDHQRQADLLNQICGSSLGTGPCRYLPSTAQTDLTAPAAPASEPFKNCTTHDADTEKRWDFRHAETNSLDITGGIEGKVLGVVKASLEVKYGHTWEDEKSWGGSATIHLAPGELGQFTYEATYDRLTGDFQLATADHVYLFKNVHYDFPSRDFSKNPPEFRTGTLTAISKKTDCPKPPPTICLPADQTPDAQVCSSATPATVPAESCLTDGFTAGDCPPPADLSDLGLPWPTDWAATAGQEFVHWDDVVQADAGAVRPRTVTCPTSSAAAEDGGAGIRYDGGDRVTDLAPTDDGGWSFTVPAGSGRYQLWEICTTTAPSTDAGTGTGAGTAAFAPRGSSTAGRGGRTVYVSLPSARTSDQDAHDLVAATRMAFADHTSGTPVSLRLLSDANPKTGESEPARARANARRAAADRHALAYVGDALSEASGAALPVLNRAGLLQVSPASTSLDLTTNRHFRGHRTFARVVPNNFHQADGLARYMHGEGLRRVFVVNDGQRYGRDLARLFGVTSSKRGVRVVGRARVGRQPQALARRIAHSRAQALLFAGTAENGALPLLRAVAAASPTIELFGGDGLADRDRFLRGAHAAGLDPRMRLVSPALDPSTLPPMGVELYRRLTAVVGHKPDPYMIYAYEAMSATLDAIDRAHGASRSAVVRAFFGTHRSDSPIGPYRITRDGDTTLASYGEYTMRNGRLEAPLCLGC
jgi:branched-chain amino acid transport system substrate-binding protein